jgi:cell division protein ZapE
MDFQSRYQDALRANGFSADAAQHGAVSALENIRRTLAAGSGRSGRLSQTLRRYAGLVIPALSNRKPVRGAYLCGDVGRGKTFLMDLFFESLPFPDKTRFHFHRFMYHVHCELKTLKNRQDPLDIVAENLAARARVICFDEFFVADIADAMLLGKLLDALFRRGVTLVATSNVPPDDLYHDGLQRKQFLPAIDLIKAHTEFLSIDGDTDYRLRVLEKAEIYHSPLDTAANENLEDYFRQIAPEAGSTGQIMEILGRDIRTVRRADGIAWFAFTDLCDGPRSQDDYIEIARSFQTIILSEVPGLDSQKENQARRFIALIDEFYDRRVSLIISAEQPIESLYAGTRLVNEFARTRSRLREMQSNDYLASPHLP